jgi:hypothetical protein
MLTYEKIIKESKDFATNHVQISSFDNGDLWEVIESNTLQNYSYPLLFMNDGQSTLNQGVLTFAFNILAVDQVLNGEVNENFVKSSMHQLCLDYLAYFKHTYMYDVEGTKLTFRIEPTASLVSFTERFNDTLTGWNMSVIFRIPFDASKCNIPLRNNPPTPTPFECADAILTLNSGTLLTVASGSTTNIVLIDQNDDPITPISVVGSTIKVNAGGGSGNVRVNTTFYGNYTSPNTFNVNVLDRSTNAIGSLNGGNWQVLNPLKGNFQAGVGVLADYVMTSEDAGVYTTLTDDGSSGTVTILINGGALVLPYTAVAGDVVSSSRSDNTAAGWYKLN